MSAEPTMTLEQDLPRGWSWAALGEICVPVTQVVPSDLFENQFTYLDISSIDNQSHRLTDTKQLGVTEAPSRARQLVLSGDTLFSTVRTYLKNIAYVNERFDGQIASTGFCILRPTDGLEGRYVFYYVLTRDFIDKISTLQRGVSYPAVRDGDVRAQLIPVAPSNEQRRIVEKIDELFSQIEAGEQALARAQKLLERYRQSVLNAAVTGDLTRDWREQDQGELESGEALLGRILQARREAWEEAELAKMHARGQPSKDNRWKQRYKEPKAPDTTGLPDLPNGWAWANLDQLSTLITSGSRNWKQFYADSGAVFIRAQNLKYDRLDLGEVASVELPPESEGTRTKVSRGDILVTITGANVTKAALVTIDMDEAYVNQHVGLVRPVLPELGDFLHLVVVCPSRGRMQLEGAAYGAGKPGLSLQDLAEVIVPLPPSAEQAAIVQNVEELASIAEHTLYEVVDSAKSARRIRSSILSSAFSGTLVPQDLADEPASVLLERIREERSAAHRSKPRRSRRSLSASNRAGAQLELLG